MSESFNKQEVLQSFGGLTEIIPEIVEKFLESSPNAIAQIQQGIETSTAKDIEHGAHTLKGSCAIFAAKNSIALAKELEQMGREGHIESAPQKLEELKTALTQLHKELSQWVEDVRTSG